MSSDSSLVLFRHLKKKKITPKLGRSFIFVEYLSTLILLVFCHNYIKIKYFLVKKHHRIDIMSCSAHHIRNDMFLMYFVTSNIQFNHLPKVASPL